MGISYSYDPGPSATMLEIKKDCHKWEDVLKVKVEGAVYNIGDTVHINRIGYGNITGFEAYYVTVSIFQGVANEIGKEASYKYSSLEYMCSPSEDGQERLDPNRAFKKKKRRMF